MKNLIFSVMIGTLLVVGLAIPAALAADKPNILLIMSDDVGITNISSYSEGLVGYKTPNIDRIANEGENFFPYFTGESHKGPREDFFYFDDGGQLIGLRFNKWKLVFAEQRAKSWDVWSEPFVPLRLPKVFNLRSDPFERADTDANGYNNWWIDHLFLLVPAQRHVAEQLETFKEFPPRQKPAKFNVSEVLEKLRTAKAAD